jgi:epoxyqueuosine reductase
MRLELLSKGAALVGFADMSEVASPARNDLPRAVSIAVALDPDVAASIKNGPHQAYYREYARANALLAELSRTAAAFLQRCGFRAVTLDPTTEKFDTKNLSAGLSHKIAATRSGLGWIGKNALVVTRPFGSAVRLATVLTDAPLETGSPFDASQCGACNACVEICPAEAPSGMNWSLGLYRDVFFNAHACRRKAKEFCEKEGIDSTICGICIEACPWTRKYINRAAGLKRK